MAPAPDVVDGTARAQVMRGSHLARIKSLPSPALRGYVLRGATPAGRRQGRACRLDVAPRNRRLTPRPLLRRNGAWIICALFLPGSGGYSARHAQPRALNYQLGSMNGRLPSPRQRSFAHATGRARSLPVASCRPNDVIRARYERGILKGSLRNRGPVAMRTALAQRVQLAVHGPHRRLSALHRTGTQA